MIEYKPRNDYVIVRCETLAENRAGVAIPPTSDEAKRWYIHAVGPKVEGLKEGDHVQIMGTAGQDLARLPREKFLWITKEANVLMVVEEG